MRGENNQNQITKTYSSHTTYCSDIRFCIIVLPIKLIGAYNFLSISLNMIRKWKLKTAPIKKLLLYIWPFYN